MFHQEILNWANVMKYKVICRDVTTGATGLTKVAPNFSVTLTLLQPRGQILPTITEVAAKIFPMVMSLI